MLFDLRLPLGLLFLATGLLVAGYGVAGHVALSAGVNIDVVWGLAMAGFGAVMLLLVLVARSRGPSKD